MTPPTCSKPCRRSAPPPSWRKCRPRWPEEIGDLLDHPSDTAGGIMQTEYVSVPQYATVEQAIGIIRRAHDDVPEVHDVFRGQRGKARHRHSCP